MAIQHFLNAKLKVYCRVRENCDIPPIWDYFKRTKDVDANITKLLEEMATWAHANDITLTRGIYFEKATIYEIIKLEFNAGAAIAYLPPREEFLSSLFD